MGNIRLKANGKNKVILNIYLKVKLKFNKYTKK